mgnify:CR=1 FL=1
MKNIQLDITKATQFLQADAIAAYEPKVKAAQEALENGTCPGNDFLGWLHLPSSITPDFIGELNATAQVLRENCEVVVVAGIGGSYLGARTVIEALSNSFQWLLNDKKNPIILFAGNNIGEDYLAEMCAYLADKKFGVINISKSLLPWPVSTSHNSWPVPPTWKKPLPWTYLSWKTPRQYMQPAATLYMPKARK